MNYKRIVTIKHKSSINKQVLMLYTGGTIGMLPKSKNNPTLVPVSWDELKSHFSDLESLSFGIDICEIALIDSSNISPENWVDIAKIISIEYENYNGFVVMHGTDTMAYTASALSFLFDNLGKPVVITGAKLSPVYPGSDAKQNLVNALKIAASHEVDTVPEVCILFGKALLRGNRSCKVSLNEDVSFVSYNYGELATVGHDIKVDSKLIRKPEKIDRGLSLDFSCESFFDSNVLCLDIFPGINYKFFENIFAIEGLKGVVLRTYGAGNAPTGDVFLKTIENAVKRGIVVVSISQCVPGAVAATSEYEAGLKLLRAGVISGADMTLEAALVKMMFLLKQENNDIDKVKIAMQKNLRGEQSYNLFN